jgi:hypothetical protein
VLRLIVGQGLGLVLAGVVVAIATALATTRLIAGVLYGVSAVIRRLTQGPSSCSA